jgi:hypothetical protein
MSSIAGGQFTPSGRLQAEVQYAARAVDTPTRTRTTVAPAPKWRLRCWQNVPSSVEDTARSLAVHRCRLAQRGMPNPPIP